MVFETQEFLHITSCTSKLYYYTLQLYLPPEDNVEHLDTCRIGMGKFVGQLDSDPYRSVVGLSTGSVSGDVVGSFIVIQAISQDYEKCGRPVACIS